MAGCSDYAAQAFINFISAQQSMPALGSRFLALFTAAPTSNAGTGGTEVTGGAYARAQIAGQVTATATWTTGVAVISIPAGQTWITPGMNVYDTTNAKQIGTVLSYSGTTLTLTANAANASAGGTDSLTLSAWPAATASVGNEPAVTSPASALNGAAITFPQATLSWGTALAWGIYDASSAGNLIFWDYLGNNKWIPFTCTLASPGVLSTDLAADVPTNGTPCIVTSKYGATLPTTGGSWSGVLTSAGASGVTFNLAVNTTSTGGGQFRQITQQAIAANVTASFNASTFTLQLA